MGDKTSPKPMHFEEADEDGAPIPGTAKHYARSIAPSSPPPPKERPNTGRSRRETKRRDSTPPNDLPYTDPESDSTAHPARRNSKMKSKEERKGSKSKTLVVKGESSKRPTIRSTKTAPAPVPSRVSDESSYYGVHQKTIASSRPRSHTRPVSYHGRPPLSGSAYFPHPQAGPPGYPPIPPNYPPSWAGPPPGAPPPMAIPPPMHPAQHQQFPPPSPDFARGSRDLSSRFDRPQSAMGYRPSPHMYEYEPPVVERSVTRRQSVSRKASKDQDDRMSMPPPPQRPTSAARRERKVLRPPARKSVNFDDDDLDDDDSYPVVSHRASVEYGHGALQPRVQSESFSDDDSFDDDWDSYQREPSRMELASSHRRASSHANYEDKIHNAFSYQNTVSGPAAPLTAETLKRVKNGGSRESTRSSGSRDESDYKHSATTRTTQSNVAEDDITIKLPEGAVVEVNGARITCPGGGDVSLGRKNENGTSRTGSDRATTVYDDDRKSRYDDDRKSRYDDDRKSRHDRHPSLPYRPRASSQAAYPRSLSHAPPMYPGGYPPYSAYPSSNYMWDDDEQYYS